MATSRISSLVMIQPILSGLKIVQTMLFEMIFLLDSYTRRSLKFLGWYGISDTLTKTWPWGLSCVFVVPSFPAMLSMAPNHFNFRLFFDSNCFFDHTRLCVTSEWLIESVSYLFSTPQVRSQQQTEILIHLLRKLAPVNDISGVSYLVDRIWIFSPRIW